jgi:hypothetical protein
MEKEILKEIHELKLILSKLIGSDKESPENQFSEEALNKAQKLYLKMSIERGDWVKDTEISRFIKPAPWNPLTFIRKEFEFTNWIKRGYEYLYSKKDLIALGEELAARNIDCKRYQDYLGDKASFDRKMATFNDPKKTKGKRFKIPPKLKNIVTTDIPKPDPELVRQDLAMLKREFKSCKFEAYIDIYKGTHAMLKNIYYYQKYLEPGLKRRCRKWCDDFNYANHALELITGKKEKFAVTDPNLIQL